MAGHFTAPSTRVTLILRIRDPRDAGAWRTFVDLYTPLIYSFCLRRGLQEADCRDVLQNVLGRVHRQISTFEYDPARGLFRNWLLTLTVREVRRYQLQADPAARGIGGGIGDQFADEIEAEADGSWISEFHARVLHFAIEQVRREFGKETWEAFEQVWVRDKKPAAVAKAMRKSPEWIYKAKHRVLQRLRQEVEFLTADNPLFLRE